MYKRDESAGFEDKADLLTKKVTCTSKDLLLLKKDTSNSSKDKSFCEESCLRPEQIEMFETPSKRQRQTYFKKSIEKKLVNLISFINYVINQQIFRGFVAIMRGSTENCAGIGFMLSI